MPGSLRSRQQLWCVAAAAAFVLGSVSQLGAQTPITAPYSVDELKRMLGSLTEERVTELVRAGCLEFRMDAFITEQLLSAGASRNFITQLNSACVREPTAVQQSARDTVVRTAVATPPAQPARKRTRSELRTEVYHRGGTVFRFAAGDASLKWSADGAETAATAGTSFAFSITSSNMGIGLEAEVTRQSAQDASVNLYHAGLTLEPFFPLGASRARIIAGGSVGGFYHNLDTGAASSRVLGATLNGRVGLAFHPSRSFFVFGDATYRRGFALVGAAYDGSGEELWNETWPDLSLGLKGWVLRIGIGT